LYAGAVSILKTVPKFDWILLGSMSKQGPGVWQPLNRSLSADAPFLRREQHVMITTLILLIVMMLNFWPRLAGGGINTEHRAHG
jgi:hypothetical protein